VLSWSDFIDRYDGAGTLFYLDPPYWGSETAYGAGVFARADFARLAQRLADIGGRFMLSVNDVPQTREAFGSFVIEPISTRYTISGRWMDVAEILVTGPPGNPLPAARDLLSL
jgi:DNA adenine methylase